MRFKPFSSYLAAEEYNGGFHDRTPNYILQQRRDKWNSGNRMDNNIGCTDGSGGNSTPGKSSSSSGNYHSNKVLGFVFCAPFVSLDCEIARRFLQFPSI